MTNVSFPCRPNVGAGLSQATVDKYCQTKAKKWTSGSLEATFTSSAKFLFRHGAIVKGLGKLSNLQVENIWPKTTIHFKFASNSKSSLRTCLLTRYNL